MWSASEVIKFETRTQKVGFTAFRNKDTRVIRTFTLCYESQLKEDRSIANSLNGFETNT